MLPAKQLIKEVITSLREVIAPAISDPYPKSQAYMAAVILEFVSRQVEERGDLTVGKRKCLRELFDELSAINAVKRLVDTSAGEPDEAMLCQLIERLYAERNSVGIEAFTAANKLIHRALRAMLDLDLQVAAAKES